MTERRIQQARRGGERYGIGTQAWVLSGLLVLLLVAGVELSAAQEDVGKPVPPLPPLPANMQSGQVTGKSESSVEINRREYTLHPKVIFSDDEGNWREWNEFKKDDFVQFHLKQGQIDRLVLEVPK